MITYSFLLEAFGCHTAGCEGISGPFWAFRLRSGEVFAYGGSIENLEDLKGRVSATLSVGTPLSLICRNVGAMGTFR